MLSVASASIVPRVASTNEPSAMSMPPPAVESESALSVTSGVPDSVSIEPAALNVISFPASSLTFPPPLVIVALTWMSVVASRLTGPLALSIASETVSELAAEMSTVDAATTPTNELIPPI